MAKSLEPPRKQALEGEQYWSWLHKLWYRATQPAQIGGAQIAFSGTNVVLGHGTSASPAGEEFAVSGSAPISVAFGTGTITVSHNTSGVASGTYGGTAGIPRFAVNTTGHVTFADQTLMSASAPITIGTGTATMTWGHATSGVATGTYGGAAVIPQIAVNTTGHVTTVNTFALTGTAVAGADLSLTTPIIFGTGTGTNILLRSANIAHATSGVVTGTYGAVNVIPQIGVTTHGHVNVVNTFGLTGTAVAGSDITLTTPIIFASGTGTNAVLRAVSIAHATSGIVPGTFGSASVIPQVIVNTYGHVTGVNTLNVAIGGTAVTGADLTLTTPLIYASGTGTNILLRAASIAHATSGIVPGTFGAANVMTQHVVTTYGHVTAINTFALAGTNVTGGDITLTTPIIFASGTGTNAVLRAVSISHGTSGVTPGTYGGTAGALRIVVDTYGHVTAAVGTAAFPGATWQVNKQTVESGESLTIEDNYQILFGGQFFINGTAPVTVNGSAGGLYIH